MAVPVTEMTRIDAPAAMHRWSDAQRATGRRIALVPTMGALHEGHLELVRIASTVADVVVVSIFVNPLQFNRAEDLAAYPQPLADDLAACAAHGVSAVYLPTPAAMYPNGFQTHVEPGPLAEPLEGAGRPGHFRGVTTVVCKLLNAAAPHVAVFGQKDFQQLAIVRRMVVDLDLDVEIVGAPTVREHDGLALSSRNRRLTSADRAAAVCVPRALASVRASFESGERNTGRLLDAAFTVLAAERRARSEYVTASDVETLQPVDVVTGPVVVSTAVWFGDVRLIDNVVVGGPQPATVEAGAEPGAEACVEPDVDAVGPGSGTAAGNASGGRSA